MDKHKQKIVQSMNHEEAFLLICTSLKDRLAQKGISSTIKAAWLTHGISTTNLNTTTIKLFSV
jgi:hypothetical protein